MNFKKNVTYLLLLASLSATAAQDVKILQFKHCACRQFECKRKTF